MLCAPLETPEPQIMMRVHQHVEAGPLGRLDQTDHNIREGQALRRFPENGVGVRILRYHAPLMTHPMPECQRTSTHRRIFFCAMSRRPQKIV